MDCTKNHYSGLGVSPTYSTVLFNYINRDWGLQQAITESKVKLNLKCKIPCVDDVILIHNVTICSQSNSMQ